MSLGSDEQLKQLGCLVGEVKLNFKHVLRNWESVKKQKPAGRPIQLQETSDYVIVSRGELERLYKESHKLKQNCRSLCQLVTESHLVAAAKIKELSLALEQSKLQAEELQDEVKRLQTKGDDLAGEAMKEKEEKFQLKCEVQELNQQLQLQSDYMTHLGASSCTLLWRVSRCEESIEAIVGGSKVDDFLSLVSITLKTFLQTYDNPNEDTDSDQTQFILALCGTITNIAASAYGREFLMKNENGRMVIDTFLSTLSDLKLGQCTKMKQLILMCMYNISINQKGGRHIINHPGIMGLLVWLLQGEKSTETMLQLIRLVHSLLCEQGSPKILHELNEVLSKEQLQDLAAHRNRDVREAITEMVNDMRLLQEEMRFLHDRSEQ